GYAVWQVVPRAWSLVWATLSGQEVPARVPHAWLQRWQGEAPVLLPETVRDMEEDHQPVPRRDEIEAANRRTLDIDRLWLSVEPHNRPAVRSYQKAGYRFRPSTLYSCELEMELELQGVPGAA
ncbi:MAG: hypothetical protein LC667_13970, partial [Thioalkalivibrio sp.]|nr:hypothetical protein [Thioalkalivibrio sp.]